MNGSTTINNRRQGKWVLAFAALAVMLSLSLAAQAAEQKTSDQTKASIKASASKAPSESTAAPEKPAAAPEKPATAEPAAAEGVVKAEGGHIKKFYPEGTPTRAIQDLDEMLDDFKVAEKGKSLTADEEAHNRALKQKIIHGTFDLTELSKQSLGVHWNKISQGERDHFVGLLTDLLEEKALFSKEQSAAKSKSGGKYFVVYRGHRFDDKAESRAFVKTKVVVPAENVDIELNYRLKKDGSTWKIYDIVVDEASLVDNYRYQFDSIIQKHGFNDLLRRMSEKLAEIKGKRKS